MQCAFVMLTSELVQVTAGGMASPLLREQGPIW